MNFLNEGSGFRQHAPATVLAVMGVLGATAALTSNAPIMASEGEPRMVRVQYGDLNLATQKGKEALSQRIRQAVDLVCFQPDPRALQMWSEYRKCMQNATDSAWSQIRWPEKPIMEAAGTVRTTP